MRLRDIAAGLAHIGLDTSKLEETIAFYSALGFEPMPDSNSGKSKVFMRLKGLMLEISERPPAPAPLGSPCHIALAAPDIEAAWEAARGNGLEIINEGIGFAPFWKNGLRYFKIRGPNGEIIEFIQIL